jgi:cytochrome c oxidase subunit 2
MKRLTIPILLTLVVTVILIVLLQHTNLVPVEASQQSQSIDNLIQLTFYIAAFIFALCMVLLLYSVVVFRRRPDDLEDAAPVQGSTPLEIAWTVGPLITVMFFGVYSARVLGDISKPPNPAKELEVSVTGSQWVWRFEYPEFGITTSELVLPVNQPVLFKLHSTDVIHSFYVPEFRVKMDTIPGIDNQIRITPTRLGEYKVRCAELCGAGHAYMLAPVRVVELSGFQDWVAAQKAPTPTAAALSAEAEQGKQYAQQFGCAGCHSVDGSKLVGPTWKGLYGSNVSLQDGTTVVANDDYLHNSIVNPGAQIVQGYPDLMPKTYKDQLNDAQIRALIEYIKSLK